MKIIDCNSIDAFCVDSTCRYLYLGYVVFVKLLIWNEKDADSDNMHRDICTIMLH